MSNESGSFSYLLWIVLGLICAFIAIVVAFYIAVFILSLGALFGGGISLRNYGLAVIHNVKLENPST